jgi:ribonuclease HI
MLARDLITIYCSSSFGPHDDGGIAYYGFVVYCGDVKIEAKYGEYGSGPGVTNNVAEYGTAIKALHWLNDYDEYQGQQVELKSASQLFIRQINGTYGVRAKGIIPLWDEVQELSRPFSVRFVRISGKENEETQQVGSSPRNAI